MSKLEHIMYVDDEADIRTVAEMALSMVGGFKVDLHENGRAAHAAALENAPQLVVLDVMMPDIDGPETLALFKGDARTAHIPVIFMTAKVREEEIQNFTALGAIGVIAKPFDPMNLSGQIEALWAEHEEKAA